MTCVQATTGRRAQLGVVSMEMLLALLPVMTVCMAIAQLGFVSVAQLVVRHAAQRAVRTAVVVFEDDPRHYNDEARGHIAQPRRARSTSRTPIAHGAHDLGATLRRMAPEGVTRVQAIRASAYLPLAVLAPSPSQLLGSISPLKQTLDADAAAHLGGALIYNAAAAAVTFPEAPQADRLRTRAFGPNDMITVRVTYLFKCEVPIAAQLMCDRLYEIELQQQAMRELAQAEAPDVRRLLYAGGGYYTTLRAEATLPNHGARYYARQ